MNIVRGQFSSSSARKRGGASLTLNFCYFVFTTGCWLAALSTQTVGSNRNRRRFLAGWRRDVNDGWNQLRLPRLAALSGTDRWIPGPHSFLGRHPGKIFQLLHVRHVVVEPPANRTPNVSPRAAGWRVTASGCPFELASICLCSWISIRR